MQGVVFKNLHCAKGGHFTRYGVTPEWIWRRAGNSKMRVQDFRLKMGKGLDTIRKFGKSLFYIVKLLTTSFLNINIYDKKTL